MPEIIQLTNISVPELDIYARLNEAQLLHYFEPEDGVFIAESPKVIERALDAGYEPISMLMEKRHIDGEAKEIIARCDVPVYTADEEILTGITGFKLTRGALCALRRKPLPAVEDICGGARHIAVLENVMNPTNVGAIFRSAAALGMDAVLLTNGCSDPLYRRAERVSMGTVFQVKWTYFDGDMSTLKKLGFATAAMALDDNSVSISDPKLASEERLAIVLGTEGDGLAPKTISDCDYTVKIPMFHGVDSLNVAAASAVAFWELGK
ncbi:MAG: RNA methyltransferase [Oscillospiraceae bacterium]|nr:RNA methyltransferase [Oscillospiraceae bacterium]